jgi:hypothetical protein
MSPLEWCCAYCFFVLGAIEFPSRGGGIDCYVEERTRRCLHNHLCESFGLSRNDTRAVTDNLSKYKFNPQQVYEALCEIKKEVEE